MRKVRLKDIGTFYSGLSGKSKKDFSDGNALLATYRNIFNNPVLNLDIKDTVVIGNGEKQNEVMYGDILFTGSSETPEEAGMSSVVMSEPKEKIYLNSFCFGFRLNNFIEVLPSYMGHLLRSESIRKAISKTAFGVTRFNINKNFLSEIEIPLPPLTIQREIVSVLDSFTTLIDKMKQEVVLRKKQMENYRGMLFAKYKGEVQKMENFVLLKAGKTISSSELSEIPNSEHRFKCYGGNGIRGYASNFIYEGNYAIIGRQGALCGSVNWVNEKFYATEHAVICFPKPNVESRFLYWLFVNSNLNQYKSQGAQPGLAVSRLNELCFPIPSISTQRSIVSTLDAFEQYISKLERLITLREKQYAYYREKLLTFE